MSQDGVGCKDCKLVREHVASLLPFTVLEAMSGKPLGDEVRGTQRVPRKPCVWVRFSPTY